jgi:general secretion pathway protein A
MYNAFFDLRKKPFQLVPNPEFLFLGKCHEEVLAHLTYATSQGDGFVEITGEVGTGKTTLCRVFLEGLDKDIEAAFIFNSKLDSTQLIKAIHKELGIISIANGPSELTVDLNDFLLEKKSQGKSVILLIDEAQNLGKETLEQIRLLSNLETTSSKLLQIILVGQPELREMIDSHEMRQLRQRVNLSCHIYPMTKKETFDYITHRVNVASRKPQILFTRSAQRDIYRFSHGIPRVINIVCDRSLLVAYSLKKKKVTPASVRIAVDELNICPESHPRSASLWKKTAILVSIVFALYLFFAVFMGIPLEWPGSMKTAGIKAAKNDVKMRVEPILTIAPADPVKIDPIKEAETLTAKAELLPDPVLTKTLPIERIAADKILPFIKDTATREMALLRIASLWNSESRVHLSPLTQQIESNIQFFKIAAAQNNLQMMYSEQDPALIKIFNLPVILGFSVPGDPVKYFLGIEAITSENEFVLFPVIGGKKYKIGLQELRPYLVGDMYIAWKDTFGYDRVISDASSKDSIMALKLLLFEMGFPLIDKTPVYDGPVEQAIKQIQQKYGLDVDGLVGPLTKMVLFNEKKQNAVPYLDSGRFESEQ